MKEGNKSLGMLKIVQFGQEIFTGASVLDMERFRLQYLFAIIYKFRAVSSSVAVAQ